jgi:hypothetical protein
MVVRPSPSRVVPEHTKRRKSQKHNYFVPSISQYLLFTKTNDLLDSMD